MEQKQIYAIYDKKHKNKVVALMNTLGMINELSAQDVVELLNNYEKDVFHYEQLLRKNARTIDNIKKELFNYKSRANNANNTTHNVERLQQVNKEQQEANARLCKEINCYKQLLKSLSENSAGIQDICSNAANCDEISCNGKKITIKNGKQIIEMEFDNGK